MKKMIAMLLAAVLCFCMVGCDFLPEIIGGDDSNKVKIDPTPVEVTFVKDGDDYIVTASHLPQTAEQLKAFDLTNEYQAGMALVCTLANFKNNYANALKMLDYIMGPSSPSEYDENFIKNQLDQYPYVMDSYFEGASVANDYTYNVPVKLVMHENLYSRDNDGYVNLWIQSAGADNGRSFTLRQKGSTGEWFLFSDSYKGLMAGIRQPASSDPWA